MFVNFSTRFLVLCLPNYHVVPITMYHVICLTKHSFPTGFCERIIANFSALILQDTSVTLILLAMDKDVIHANQSIVNMSIETHAINKQIKYSRLSSGAICKLVFLEYRHDRPSELLTAGFWP